MPAITAQQVFSIPPSPGFYEPTSRSSYCNTIGLSPRGEHFTTKTSLFISRASSSLHLIQFSTLRHLNAFPDLCAGSAMRNQTFFPTSGPIPASVALPWFSSSPIYFFLETGKEGTHKPKRDYNKIINMGSGSKKWISDL